MIYSAKAFSLTEHLEYSALIQKQSCVLLIKHISAESVVSGYLDIFYTSRDYPECATNVNLFVVVGTIYRHEMHVATTKPSGCSINYSSFSSSDLYMLISSQKR